MVIQEGKDIHTEADKHKTMSSIFKKAKERSSRDKMRTTSGTSISSFNPHNPLNAPTEVALATQSHIARTANELTFKKGDFFHIVQGTAVAPDGTIEIFDPINNIKGKAPAGCFKIFEKTHRPGEGESRVSSTGSTSLVHPAAQEQNDMRPQRQASSRSGSSAREENALGNLFGVVLYDFKAERSDELSVNAGDIIFICAHHEYEWYIAKFLNKVGEVGLVPVSYVQLIDAITRIPYKESPRTIIDGEGLPTVDEWKIIKNKHKASSKSVGVHDSSPLSRNSSQSHTNGRSSISKSPMKHNLAHSLVIPTKANIESFSSTNNKFWFLIRVTMSDGSFRSLCRYYEDFFNFHQKVLSTWQREGGKFDTKERKERILPFIPGPVVDVTESLCHKRLIDLNEYLNILLQLPDYISKSHLVLSFFDLMDGDSDSNMTSSNFGAPVEPNRIAPNLKIINTDNNRLSNQQKYQSQPNDSQSNIDRKSQYDMRRNSAVSNRNPELTSTRKSSVSSLSQGLSQVHLQSTSSPINTNVPTPLAEVTKLKLKFYYHDDIFAISVPSNITLNELKSHIIPKLDEDNVLGLKSKIKLYSKNVTNTDQLSYDSSTCITTDSDLWRDENFVDKGKFLIVVD